jgi:hypothetical protein
MTPLRAYPASESRDGREQPGEAYIRTSPPHGGSPATPDELRKRFDTFMNERCKGKDASKLRFVVE